MNIPERTADDGVEYIPLWVRCPECDSQEVSYDGDYYECDECQERWRE
jgi:hypothetical protein